ncbi:hypothetical protein M9458_032707, partial [Cirrhinus mrigala]
DPVLSADMDTCSEALAQLDDVIMHTFQQCVYHLTKTLYSLLPALLDTNPFSSEEKKKGKAGAKDRAGNEGEGDEEEDGSTLPPTVAGLVEVSLPLSTANLPNIWLPLLLHKHVSSQHTLGE